MMYGCLKCGQKFQSYRKKCICGAMFSIIRFSFNQCESKIKTAKELMRDKPNGKTVRGFEFLGELPSEWYMLVSGNPGGGKSSFCMMLASVLASKKPALYWSYEEGHSESLKRKLRQNRINSENLFFTKAETYKEFKKELSMFQPSVYVIDSLNDIGLGIEHVKELKTFGFPGIYIAHFTKAGKYKGNSHLEHEVHISCLVEDLKISIQKTRFGEKKDNISIRDIKI